VGDSEVVGDGVSPCGEGEGLEVVVWSLIGERMGYDDGEAGREELGLEEKEGEGVLDRVGLGEEDLPNALEGVVEAVRRPGEAEGEGEEDCVVWLKSGEGGGEGDCVDSIVESSFDGDEKGGEGDRVSVTLHETEALWESEGAPEKLGFTE